MQRSKTKHFSFFISLSIFPVSPRLFYYSPIIKMEEMHERDRSSGNDAFGTDV